MNTTNGKIAAGSRQKMAQALLTLMEQYPYREITVTQIAQEAGLSRKTFYRLFSDKDEVLDLSFEGLYQVYSDRVRAAKPEHYWDVAQLFFNFWEERKDLLSLLQKNGLLPRVLDRSYHYAVEVFSFVRPPETAEALSPALPYLLSYSVGGLHGMLLKWAQEGMVIPSDQLIAALKAGFQSPLL